MLKIYFIIMSTLSRFSGKYFQHLAESVPTKTEAVLKVKQSAA